LKLIRIYVKIFTVTKRETRKELILMEIVRNIVLVIYVLVCIVLIVLATIQARDTNGASQTVTGAAANNFYEQNKGRTKEGKIKRATVVTGVLFVVLAIALSILFVM
jgi:preprotein translocase subunit SecG